MKLWKQANKKLFLLCSRASCLSWKRLSLISLRRLWVKTLSPVMITQSEYMRRMKEMANIQAGMSFYGEMPDMFNLVLNSDHKLVKEVLADEEKECDSVVVPIQQEMNDVDKRRNELKDKQKGKKDEEISTAEKDEVNGLDQKWEELKTKKDEVFAGYAAKK